MNWLRIVVASLMRQIEKLNKKKADRSDIERLEQELPEGLPEGYTANQQLVTDADGVAIWEGKPFYVGPDVRVIIPERTYDMLKAEISGLYNVDLSELSHQGNDYYDLVNDPGFHIVWDGVPYSTPFENPYGSGSMAAYYWGNGAIVDSSIKDTGEPFVMLSGYWGLDDFPDGVGSPHIFTREGERHTIAFGLWDDAMTHPLDSKFIPPTVPVFLTASVGQVVAVKNVNKFTGMPTEWECVDSGELFTGIKLDFAIAKTTEDFMGMMLKTVVNGELPARAFQGSRIIVDVTIPTSTRSIGRSAFENCVNLALTKLPYGLENIGFGAFFGCTNLALTSIPSSVKVIEASAFYNCTSLKTLTFEGTPNSINGGAFYNCTNLTTINVPWAEGEVTGAPWGARNATINYNH